MALICITTDGEVANKVEKLFQSKVFTADRSLRVKGIEHHEGYSNIFFEVLPNFTSDKVAKDLFWCGWYAAQERMGIHK